MDSRLNPERCSRSASVAGSKTPGGEIPLGRVAEDPDSPPEEESCCCCCCKAAAAAAAALKPPLSKSGAAPAGKNGLKAAPLGGEAAPKGAIK